MEGMVDDARPVPPFRCEQIQRSQLAKEWKSWRSALEIYFDAYDVTDQRKMRAKLLHFGGRQLQSVFDSFSDNVKAPLDSSSVYDLAIEKLNEYFEPNRQYILERVRLRKMRQETNERFTHFVMRIRQQVAHCGLEKFSPEVKEVLTEVLIIDTITEGCSSEEVRRSIMRRDRSLAKIEELGSSMECVDQQVKDIGSLKVPEPRMEKAFRVEKHARATHFRQTERYPRSGSNNGFGKCYRCGVPGHRADSEECRARGQKCHYCKAIGHFGAVCTKRITSKQNSQNIKRVRVVEREEARPVSPKAEPKEEVSKQPKKEYYCFYSGNESNIISCTIGGVHMKMLVDSGSDANVINASAWQKLKQEHVDVKSMKKGTDQVLRGYGSSIPLRVCGTFEASVGVSGRTVNAMFFVVEAGQCCLLGNATSKALGVLKVGVNCVDQSPQPFGKIKDVQVNVHIDPSFKPVFQPVRRVPIPMEAAVNKKLEEMLARDIIEVND